MSEKNKFIKWVITNNLDELTAFTLVIAGLISFGVGKDFNFIEYFISTGVSYLFGKSNSKMR